MEKNATKFSASHAVASLPINTPLYDPNFPVEAEAEAEARNPNFFHSLFLLFSPAMGSCQSCDSTSAMTAKLILRDGNLQEFSYPVKASHVLQTDPNCFICNSDDMDFDGFLSAVNADDELQPGQLYFALPLSRLRRPLQPDEMAALAVKASTALRKVRGALVEDCGCRRRGAVSPYGASREDNGSGAASQQRREEKKKRRGRNGRGRDFEAQLGAIPE